MNAKSLSLIAALLLSFSAHAHDCSGGANGGVDATGNQCNDVASVATLDSESWGSRALEVGVGPTTAKEKSASHTKNAMKRTVAVRHSSTRSPTKHS